MPIMFNKICINKEMLPKYTYLYVYMCVYIYISMYIYMCICIYMCVYICVCMYICICIRGTFNTFPDFFVQAFKINVDSSKFTILFLYIL